MLTKYIPIQIILYFQFFKCMPPNIQVEFHKHKNEFYSFVLLYQTTAVETLPNIVEAIN